MDFNHYFTNAEIETLTQDWIEKYPDLIERTNLGESYEKRPIWLLTLTNRATGDAKDKPAIWLDANIHATEISGTTTVLFFAAEILQGYGKDLQATRILDTTTIYIVPRVNPDGAELAMSTKPRFIRSGVRMYPWEDLDEGLQQEDIDQDGRILQMRIPDPHGDWKISTLDARLMEKRGISEQGGTYYRVFPEGMLKDYDGHLVKLARPPQGLDFNRNFPFDWRPEGEQAGAGPYPTSEPEIRAVVDFITSHTNINLALTFHTFSRVLLRPYSTKPDDAMEIDDLWIYQKIGELGTQITGYRNVSTYHEFRYHPKEVSHGCFDDWVYDHLGAFIFTVELWDLPTEAGIKDRKWTEWFRLHPHEDDVKILHWVDAQNLPDAYIHWYPFNHPQLGPLEIGGWNMQYTWRNPPQPFIQAEASRHTPFILALAELTPLLAIHKLEVKPVGDDLYWLNLVVENTGFLPTYTSQQAKKQSQIRPVRVELELPEQARLVSGKNRVELGHLEGRSNKMEVSIFSSSPTDNRARAEWVIQAPPGTTAQIVVKSERAGTIRKRVDLTSTV